MNPRNRLGVCVFLAAGMMGSIGLGLAGVSAGPPLVCQEFEIGNATTLPISERAGHSHLANLPGRVVELLKPGTPVVVRMETLRRAVIVGGRDRGAMTELMSALQARVLDAEATGTTDGMAWFDAAFLAASWDQMDEGRAPNVGVAEGCVGYAWLKKAISVSQGSPEMEFAAALLTHPAMRKATQDVHEAHLSRAAAGAIKGSLLDLNLKAHCENWNRSYEALKNAGAPRAADTRR